MGFQQVPWVEILKGGEKKKRAKKCEIKKKKVLRKKDYKMGKLKLVPANNFLD